MINLPMRKDVRCPVNFTADERGLYERVKHQAIAHLAEASTSHDGGETSQSVSFVNVIQQINALRMICDLGLHYGSRHETNGSEYQFYSSESVYWASMAQQAFNFQCEIATITCQGCKSSLDITERVFSGSNEHVVEKPLFFQCMSFICADCLHRLHGHSLSCGHEPPHPFSPVSLNASVLEESGLPAVDSTVGNYTTSTGLPSKVTSLVAQLKAQPSNVKRSVKRKIFTKIRLTSYLY